MLNEIASSITTVPAIGAEPSLAPTGLESFVAKPTVVLDLAEEVGSLQGADATVTVAAVIATDSARPDEQMKDALLARKPYPPVSSTWTKRSSIPCSAISPISRAGGPADFQIAIAIRNDGKRPLALAIPVRTPVAAA